MSLIHRWPLTSGPEDVVGGLATTNNGGVQFGPGGATFSGANWLQCTRTRPPSLTMSIWVQPYGVGAAHVYTAMAGADSAGSYASSWGLCMVYDAGTTVAFYCCAYQVISADWTTSNFQTDKLTLLAMTYNNSTQTFSVYRNAGGVGQITVSAAVGSDLLAIGRWGGYPRYWKGILADARVYDHAMSAEEISALHASGPNGECWVDPRYSPLPLPAILNTLPASLSRGCR